MRLFQALLLDTHFNQTWTSEFASDAWACLLSRADTMKFTCIVDEVAGISPNLTLTVYGSALPNTVNYLEIATLINAAPLATGPNAISASFTSQSATNPPPKELFVQASVAGSGNLTAHVRVWVCGRGPQLLETVQAVNPSFAAQYAAARMIEDQNRLPDRKRALPQGASLFYPPELFLPSLTWGR